MKIPPIFNRMLLPLLIPGNVHRHIPRCCQKQNKEQQEVPSNTMHIELNPILKIYRGSDSQPYRHICEDNAQKGMDEHIPSPVVAEPSVHAD
jgi:hypothetical protein